MLRKGWNFHNDIAIRLEGDAQEYFRDSGRPVTKIYDADGIENGRFVEVMILLLREKAQFENSIEEIEEFVESCAPYFGKSGNQIDPEKAESLYKRFTELFR